jgi:Fe-S oxidoreductase
VILFADVFTNYNNPDTGMAVVRVFSKPGFPVTLSNAIDDGRGLLSQGMISKAEEHARKLAVYLEKFIDDGKDIIVSEPSVLSMFRRDYKRLLDDDVLFQKIADHSFDPIEYFNTLIDNGKLDMGRHLKDDDSSCSHIFYHGHCQLKTIRGGKAAVEFFRRLGFDVEDPSAECCGMAGSFGYKKQYL